MKERREYQIAVDLVPELVESESRLVDFLRTERYHPERAAQRLLCYWKHRKSLFGERWLLPMNQSGRGTLTYDDVAILRQGHLVPIVRADGGRRRALRATRGSPSPMAGREMLESPQKCLRQQPKSTNQGILLLYDRSRLSQDALPPDVATPTFIAQVQIRILFNYATVLTDEPSQTQGVTLLRIIQSGSRDGGSTTGLDPRSSLNLDPMAWEIYLNALPVRIHQVLAAAAYEPGREHWFTYLAEQAALVTKYRTNGAISTKILPPHAPPEHTLQILHQEHYCSPAHVPTCLGGLYTHTQFEAWMQQRLTLEVEMLSSTSSASSFSPYTTRTKRASGGFAASGDRVGGQKRRRVASPGARSIYSCSTVGGGGAADDTSSTNSLLQTASGPEDDPSESQEPIDIEQYKKKRNSLYVRRFNHRQNMELLGTQDQVTALQRQGEILRQDNARLEALLEQALRQLSASVSIATPRNATIEAASYGDSFSGFFQMTQPQPSLTQQGDDDNEENTHGDDEEDKKPKASSSFFS